MDHVLNILNIQIYASLQGLSIRDVINMIFGSGYDVRHKIFKEIHCNFGYPIVSVKITGIYTVPA